MDISISTEQRAAISHQHLFKPGTIIECHGHRAIYLGCPYRCNPGGAHVLLGYICNRAFLMTAEELRDYTPSPDGTTFTVTGTNGKED